MSTTEQGSNQPDRKHLTFEQAEGLEPLPSQLKRGEISQEFRARIWVLLKRELEKSKAVMGSLTRLGQPWLKILQDAQVDYHHEFDELSALYSPALRKIRLIVEGQPWFKVLGWLEFVLKHPKCPPGFASATNALMTDCRLAYRIVDGQVICPVGSDDERQTIERAFVDVAAPQFHGARTHLRNAAEELTAGHYADSVRESINAVESVAEVLEPSGELSKALAKLEKSGAIHPAMKKGFIAIYGYTSDEKGVRHALLETGAPKVDETDALFMIGACAAFVSYMINKARKI